MEPTNRATTIDRVRAVRDPPDVCYTHCADWQEVEAATRNNAHRIDATGTKGSNRLRDVLRPAEVAPVLRGYVGMLRRWDVKRATFARSFGLLAGNVGDRQMSRLCWDLWRSTPGSVRGSGLNEGNWERQRQRLMKASTQARWHRAWAHETEPSMATDAGHCRGSLVRVDIPGYVQLLRHACPSSPVAYIPRGVNPRQKGAKTWSGGRCGRP